MKLMFFSDTPAVQSGMGRVAFNLGKYFHAHPNIEFAAIGWHHASFENNWNGWKVYPSSKLTMVNDQEPERKAVQAALEDFQPDILVTLSDVWDMQYMQGLNEAYPNMRWLAYYNVDSTPLTLDHLRGLADPLQTVVTSHYGKQVVAQTDPSIDVDVVWHGYDPAIYRWLNIPNSARKLWEDPDKKTKVALDVSNKFVIFMDSQNSRRKNYTIAIDIFQKFSQDKDDVHLLMCTNQKDTVHGYDLEYYLEYCTNIKRGTANFLPNDMTKGQWFDDQTMNKFYNISDVYLSTSMVEGFGLSFLQAMATKTIPVAIDYASHTELLSEGRGVLVDVATYEVDRSFYRKLAHISVDDAVEKLNVLYEDWQNGGTAAKEYHRKGMQFALENTWENSFENLGQSIAKMCKKKKECLYPNNPYVTYDPALRSRASLRSRVRTDSNERVGMMVMGGLGDNIQAIPIIKGIERRHPNSELFVLCEANPAIFYDWKGQTPHHSNMDVMAKPMDYLTAHKSLHNVFDYFYDIRYVSKVYRTEGDPPIPEDTWEFFNEYKSFYHSWPWANNVIYQTDKHIVDIRLISAGLQHHASVDDMKIPVLPMDLPNGKFVSIHNSAGGVGTLKVMPQQELAKVVDFLNKKGYYVLQTGFPTEELIPGALDLRHRTNYWQTGYILQNAEIHIGPEGALYHMCKAVGGRSLVWLSVTSPECFIYDDSIVLPHTRTNDFKCQPCWWKGGDYFHNKCMLGREHCINLPSGEEIINALDFL